MSLKVAFGAFKFVQKSQMQKSSVASPKDYCGHFKIGLPTSHDNFLYFNQFKAKLFNSDHFVSCNGHSEADMLFLKHACFILSCHPTLYVVHG